MKAQFNEEVMLAGWSETHNGGAKVTFWLSDSDSLEAFKTMTVAKGKTAGQRLAMCLVEIGDDERPKAALSAAQELPIIDGFGQYANILYKIGWFYNKQVIESVGTDAEFLSYVKTQPCACQNNACGGDIVAAHVRRVADGAGVGIKPLYSAIPLCNNHHQAQHQSGESAIGGKDFCDKQAAIVKVEFIKSQIYKQFNVETMADLDKEKFVLWCETIGIYDTLPLALKG